MIKKKYFFIVVPQLALPVEIVDPISLCWGPANLHIIVS
ncbi:hypothetical protein IS99_2291 [Staphylococcus aureus subsp. aureus IS-99]|nr:hypothetical protein IS99_2291 [Staphylococcus aureus subsp. aureus IS-99]